MRSLVSSAVALFVASLGALFFGCNQGGGDQVDCARPPFLSVPASHLVSSVTTTGSCTATCDGNPPCSYVRVQPVAEGPCTVRVDLADGRAYEAETTVHRSDGVCAGLYAGSDMLFHEVDAGPPDASGD